MIRNSKGQALVEVAIVLPLMGLGVFMALQLIWYCHNMLELQRMAMITADQVTFKTRDQKRHYTLFDSLWGRILPPNLKRTSRLVPNWLYASPSLTVSKDPGYLVEIETSTDLLPSRGFIRFLPVVKQHAFAEILLDAPLADDE